LLIDVRALGTAFFRQNIFLGLTLLIAYLCLSVSWAPALDRDDPLTQMLMVFLLLYGIGCNLNISEQRLLQLLSIGIFTCTLASVVVFALLAAGHSEVLQNGRIFGYGPLINPLLSGNLYGCYLVALIGIVASAPPSRLGQLAFVVAALLILALILGTESRSPLLALGVAITAISLRKRNPAAFKLWALTMATAALLGIIFWQTLAERGLSLRPEIWSQVIALCLQKPWFGHGLGASIQFMSDGVTWYDTHNIPLAIWYAAGLPALLAWLILNGWLVWALWRTPGRMALVALGWLIYGIIATTFEGSGLPSRPTELWYLLWLPFALGFWTLRQPVTR
jgi:O-antigen ligase